MISPKVKEVIMYIADTAFKATMIYVFYIIFCVARIQLGMH